MPLDQHMTHKLVTSRTRSGGRVVDEWVLRSPFRGRKGAPKLSATVSIETTSGDGVTFIARSESLAASISDTDIERLREKVEAALRHQHDVLTGVTWEDWLQVVVRGRRSHRELHKEVESDLHVAYSIIKRGVDPKNGEAFYINTNGLAMPFPKPKKAGEADPDDENNHGLQGLRLGARETEYEYSYLPATPENLAGLEELIERMQQVRERLSEFLRQDSIQQSLTGLLTNTPALSAPI